MSGINLLAVLAAAASSFMIGGLWYSPALFGNVWNRENGGVKQDGHPGRVFGVAFVFSLISAFAFAWWLGPQPSLHNALHHAALPAAAMVAASYGINYQFANRSFKLWAIDAGYHAVQFTVFGLVLALWH